MSAAPHSTIDLADGAQMAYEILGSQHLGLGQPLVLIGGMSSRRIDWERLAVSLADVRPVLLFDHRGMGDSRLPPGKDTHKNITIDSLARDLLFLLEHLQWKELSLCGFSMGGLVAQQLLFLPFHPANPAPLPFRVTHVILAGTLCSVLTDKRYGLPVNKNEPPGPLTLAQKRELARPTLVRTFDPNWIANKPDRFEWWLSRMISGGRPTSVIVSQGRATNRFDFTGCHDKLSRDIRFLVIHGELDAVVPFYCGQEILQRIPWAKMVQIGKAPGQVESYAFGHHWFEYFDIRVWHDVMEKFLGESKEQIARL
ncbi:putative serine aminopeptidase, S33 [Lyophyllum shimeji]|uniref:Serine aminopeptidase, S33 n=1 Tax=Lyophyllum shimeji TaxID=47721 RepID=A0A9P3PG01_LYOSH|nr:putative serine aminopeptidase, S33 [Lyophyllum shimeji]